MTMRHFLACAYAMLVDEYQRIGIDLLSALEKVNNSLGLSALSHEQSVEASDEKVPTAADNTQPLAELQQMMGGVS